MWDQGGRGQRRKEHGPRAGLGRAVERARGQLGQGWARGEAGRDGEADVGDQAPVSDGDGMQEGGACKAGSGRQGGQGRGGGRRERRREGGYRLPITGL